MGCPKRTQAATSSGDGKATSSGLTGDRLARHVAGLLDLWLADRTAADSRPRRGCLDCAEKHIGAAMVLIGEAAHGYPHRLLAVGHLHEAAEESHPWPALHDAAHEARRAWQAEGVEPDWQRLGELLDEARTA